MDDFSGRLRLQKIVYVVQAFGIYLGYDFQWYLRGPYCTKLTRKGFELCEVYNEILNTDVEFNARDAQMKFDKARKFLEKLNKMELKINFTDKLEIVASIHSLLSEQRMGVQKVIEIVADKQLRFSQPMCQEILKLMGKFGIDRVGDVAS